MTEMQNPMSPTLAGIVSDPSDSSRRIVPASQRADGSVRKERKVRPGHVPAEDVAKYRPGQGSLRAQHAVAQASHQAPLSPSPTPASALRKPSPSDFLTDSKLREQQSQQQSMQASSSTSVTQASTKASKSGASSSRWAVAAPASEEAPSAPTPAPAPAPTAAVPTSPRLTDAGRGKPRTRGGPRQGKAPAIQQPFADKANPSIPAQSSEGAKENIPQEQEQAAAEVPTNIPSTPESKIPELPETPGGDWWDDDDDDDEEVEAAAQALQGISIKDSAARQQGAASPTPQSSSAHRGPPAQHHGTSNGRHQGSTSNHAPRESQAKSGKKAQSQHQTPAGKAPAGNNKASSGNLLSRLGPPVPVAAEAEKPITASLSVTTSKLTVEEIKTKARSISQELRQMNQLKKYAEAGAVLSNEQRSQLDTSRSLARELGDLQAMADSLAAELAQLVEATRT